MISLLLLGLAGLWISGYFTLVTYRVIKPDSALIPRFCRMKADSCELVVHHPDACLFGIPNSALGIAYYLLVIAVATSGTSGWFGQTMMYASWLAVLVAAYLVYSLLFKIKAVCPLCMMSHGVNLVIAILFTVERGLA